MITKILSFVNRFLKFLVFVGFDLEKIKQEKTYDDYEYGIILKVFSRFVSDCENFTMESLN